jgi:hypothetical protein
MWNFQKEIYRTSQQDIVINCPNRVIVIQVCNQNSIRDDNFDVFLNDVEIGKLDLNSNTQVGSVMIATTNPLVNVTTPDFVCPLNLMQTYRFNPNLIVGGLNTIRMVNTQNNLAANEGTVQVRNYLATGNNLSNPCLVADLTYKGASGLSFTLPFNYTECCPND